MGRLPEELIKRVKAEVDLVQLIQSQGHTLTKRGKDYAMRCLWHDDKTPSLIVSPDTNLWHCCGSCGMGGSTIDWLIKSLGLTFVEAVKVLEKELPASSVCTETISPSNPTALAESFSLLAAPNQTLLLQVIRHCHKTLLNSEEALAYLAQRGLRDDALIERFQLGYANCSLNDLLPSKHSNAGRAARQRVQQIGWCRPTGHEHFNGCLVVPVMDGCGIITEVYGRKMATPGRPDALTHLYLPGAHAGVWNPACLSEKEIILCESLIDAMSFWVHGFTNVTASYGTGGFTADHHHCPPQKIKFAQLSGATKLTIGNKAGKKTEDMRQRT